MTILSFLAFTNVFPQGNWSVKDRNWTVEMLFSEAKTKALILSYDDGAVQDRKLVKLLNQYGLKGTFHLNSGRLDQENVVGSGEIKPLYMGHEVSSHSYNHPGMKGFTDVDVFYEVGEDRRVLEQLTGKLVRGMAYPFGSYNPATFKTLSSLGIEYGRTVEDTYGFSIPTERLKWNPSAHKFSKAGYMGNSPEEDRKEYALFDSLTNAFLETDQIALYYVWGHSWEYDKRWGKVEVFFQKMANREDISYLTHIELVDYLNAYEGLRISSDKKNFYNPSSTDVFIRCTNYSDVRNPRVETIKISAGSTYKSQ